MGESALLWLYTVTSKSPEYEEFLHDKAVAYVAEMDAFARSIDTSVSWIYLHYADT